MTAKELIPHIIFETLLIFSNKKVPMIAGNTTLQIEMFNSMFSVTMSIRV